METSAARAWEQKVAEIEQQQGAAAETEQPVAPQPLRITMLGAITVTRPGGVAQPISGARSRALLGLMVADQMQRRRLDRHEFWRIAGGGGDDDLEHSRKAMNQGILRLREAKVKVFGQPDLLQLAGDESIAAAPSSGEFALLNGTSAWAGAGGMSSGAKLGRVSAVLADGDWLWVGGAEGMVGRDPIQRKYRPVSGTAGVDRIERVGDSVVAWDSSGPRVVVQGDSGLTTARPSFNTSSVLTSPGENLIGVTNSHDGPLFRGVVRADPSVESLFRSEATLGNEIRAAALDENGGVLLKGADGSLLRYTLGTRSLSVMARASELPKSWDFMPRQVGAALRQPCDRQPSKCWGWRLP